MTLDERNDLRRKAEAADHSENILDMVGTCKDSLQVDQPADRVSD